jgi:hypothetical protein
MLLLGEHRDAHHHHKYTPHMRQQAPPLRRLTKITGLPVVTGRSDW